MNYTEFYTEYNIKSRPSSPILYWSDLTEGEQIEFQDDLFEECYGEERTFARNENDCLVEITEAMRSQDLPWQAQIDTGNSSSILVVFTETVPEQFRNPDWQLVWDEVVLIYCY
jgi:hypothetical protein